MRFDPRHLRVSAAVRCAGQVAVIALATALTMVPVRSAADVVIVDANGSGDFRDIQPAIASAGGGTVRVLAGQYVGPIVIGVEAGPVTLECESPLLVTLHNPLGDTITVGQGASAVIRGCLITGNGVGIALYAGSSTTVQNSVVAWNASHGIFNVEDQVAQLTVRNSTIVGNAGSGILMYNWYQSSAPFFDAIDSWSLVNNIVASNGSCGIGRARQYCCSGANYMFPNLPTLSYNNVHQNGPNYCEITPDGGSRSDPPGFVNQGASDFRLRSDSNSRNQGRPSPADNDFDGTRNDLGAFGGPGARGFYPASEHGPVVPWVGLAPGRVGVGEAIQLEARGEAAR